MVPVDDAGFNVQYVDDDSPERKTIGLAGGVGEVPPKQSQMM